MVDSTLEAFWFFDGAARLERLGGNLEDASVAYRRKWGLMPSSLGLAVVRVPQHVAKDCSGRNSVEFRRWRRAHPLIFETSTGYGGNTLLFFRVESVKAPDGDQRVDGLECRVLRGERLDIHSRDLYLLADELEGEGTFGKLGTEAVGDVGK